MSAEIYTVRDLALDFTLNLHYHYIQPSVGLEYPSDLHRSLVKDVIITIWQHEDF